MRPKPALVCLAFAVAVGGFCFIQSPATISSQDTPPAETTPAQTQNPFDNDEQQQFLSELTPDERATLVSLRSRYVLADPECPLPTSEQQPFIVKFRTTLDAELAERFKSAGARLLGYVKSHTYFMRAENAAALNEIGNLLASTPQVAGTVLRERTDGCSEDLWQLLEEGAAPSGEYRILFWSDVTHEQALELLNTHAADITRATLDDHGRLDLAFNHVDVFLDGQSVLPVLDDWRVEWMQPTPQLRLHNQNAVALSNGLQSQVGAGTSYGLTGEGLVVGVWDGGSPYDSHGDLQGAAPNSPINNGSKRVRRMTGSIANHPTHVTGTIIGDGTGLTSARGFAPNAYALGYSFGGQTQTERREARHEYRIIASNHSYGASYGYPRGGYDGTARTEDQDNRDLLILQTRSSGNDGPYDNSIQDDAGHKNAFIVGATYDSGNIASLSSRGPSDDGRLQPTITANGYQVTSTASSGSYSTASGTSMSSPAACGALTLITEHWRNQHNGRFLAPDTARGIVGITAQDNGPTGPDYVYGLGIIDVKAACDLINADVASGGKNIVRGAVRQNETLEWEMNVSGSSMLRVSLSWLDLPASTSASVFLVNDLDLEVESPGGTVYYPYRGATSNSVSSTYQWTTTGPNRRDNIEVLEVDNPQSGTWKVRVTGHDIPANAQGAPNDVQGFVLCTNRAVEREFVYVEDSVNSGGPIATGGTMTRNFSVSHTGTVTGVRLYADIRHTARGDIGVIIEHPDGTQAHVETDDTNTKDDLIAVWPDTRQYDDDVTTLFNRPANGTWKVIITDSGSLGSGTMEFLALEIDVEAGSGGGGGGGPNSPPTADAGPDFSVTEGVQGQLNGSGSDPDGDPLNFSWTQLSGPAISLSNSNVAQPTFTAPAVAANTTATFRLTVSDGSASDTDDVTITILDSSGGNNPPNAYAGPDAYAAYNAAVTLDGTGSSDPDGDTLSFSWTQTSGPTVNLQGANTATPGFTAPGFDATLTFELTVNDGNGATSNDFVTITVNETGLAPTGGGGGGGGGSSGGGGCNGLPGGGSSAVLVLLALAGLACAGRRARA